MNVTRVVAAVFPVLALVATLHAAPAQAQYRNQGVRFAAGWLGLGTWDRVLNDGKAAQQQPPEPGWNLYDQPSAGAGYFTAIGYDLWFDFQAVIGAWTTVLDQSDKATPVITLMTSVGLRYNFLSERVRPFLGAYLQYFQLIALPSAGSIAPVPGNGFLGNSPFFVGLQPTGGVEWIFGDEVSVAAELGVTGFLVPDADRGLGGLFLPASTGRVSLNIYF